MFNNYLLKYLFIIYLITTSIYGQTTPFNWAKQIGGKSNERGTAIEVDNFGNIYCTGTISDTTHFADSIFVTDFDNIFISKFSSSGDLLWVRSCGGIQSDRGQDLKVDNQNNIVVTGYFKSAASFGDTSFVSLGYEDIFIAKYDPFGVLQWVLHAGGSNHSEGLCIAVDINDNIYVSGYFAGNLFIGPYTLVSNDYSTLFLAKISEDGTVLWAKQSIGENFGESTANDLICDSNGNIIVTGFFNDTFILPDTTFYSADGSDDIFIIKYDSSGSIIWNTQIGGNYDDYGNALTIDENDNIYLAGQFRDSVNFGGFSLTTQDNNTDIFYSKINSLGNFEWVKQSTGIFTDKPYSLHYEDNYGLSMCGSFIGDFTVGDSTFTSASTEEVFLANFEPSGSFKSAITLSENSGDDVAFDVCIKDNNAYLIGIFHYSLIVGNNTLNSFGLADVFVTQLNLSLINEINIEDDNSPSDYLLLQNYPNPFNPSTKIQFTIPKFGFIGLSVYDMLGKKVATLVDETKPVGNYEVDFNASKLSSGIYFYQLRAGSFKETKKMLLIK